MSMLSGMKSWYRAGYDKELRHSSIIFTGVFGRGVVKRIPSTQPPTDSSFNLSLSPYPRTVPPIDPPPLSSVKAGHPRGNHPPALALRMTHAHPPEPLEPETPMIQTQPRSQSHKQKPIAEPFWSRATTHTHRALGCPPPTQIPPSSKDKANR
ncbi:hypothetical protein VTK56DRAFT_5761 [Thermocarpiscus australiensis]